jgi:protein O-mannosyl-transferase
MIKRREHRKPRTDWNRRHVLAIIFLLVTIFLAYSNSLNGTWAMDDTLARRPVVMHDIHDVIGFRKVAYLTFLLNQYLAPFTPLNFRLFNVLIHFLNVLLIYALAYKTIFLLYEDDGRRGDKTADASSDLKNRAFSIALISGAVFALHPLNINAVAYIVQRMALLATFFVLLSLLCYIAASRSSGITRTVSFYTLTAVFLIAGIFSKENAVMAVPLILLYDYVFLSKFDKKLFGRKMLVVLGLAAASIGFAAYSLNFYSRFDELVHMFINFNKQLPDKSWMATDVYWTPLQHVLTEFRVISRYIFLIFVPLPRFLVFDWWGYHVSSGLAEPLTTLSSMVLILSLLAFSIWKLRRFPLLSFGILWYFIAISLESFVALGSDLYFEHRNYLPLAGLVIGIAGQSLVSSQAKEKVVWGVTLALCLVLGSLTFARNFVWKDSITLWTDTLQKNPYNIRAAMSLGNAYLKAADTKNAEKYYKDVMIMSGEEKRAHFFNDGVYSLGMIYLAENEMEKAKDLIDRFDRTVDSYKPKILRAYYNSLNGRLDEAISEYSEVLPETEGDIDTVTLYTLLGDAYRAKGMWDTAIEEYTKALSIDPAFASAYYGMGVTYMSKRNIPRAYEYFRESLAIDPNNSLALADMADLMLIRGVNTEDALFYARRAVAQSPFLYQPYLTLANILTVMGREEEAAEFYDNALKHGMPGYMLPFSRARAYYLKGDKDKGAYYVSQLRKFKHLPENIRSILGNTKD